MIGLIILNSFMGESQMLMSILKQKMLVNLIVVQIIQIKAFKGKVRLKWHQA